MCRPPMPCATTSGLARATALARAGSTFARRARTGTASASSDQADERQQPVGHQQQPRIGREPREGPTPDQRQRAVRRGGRPPDRIHSRSQGRGQDRRRDVVRRPPMSREVPGGDVAPPVVAEQRRGCQQRNRPDERRQPRPSDSRGIAADASHQGEPCPGQQHETGRGHAEPDGEMVGALAPGEEQHPAVRRHPRVDEAGEHQERRAEQSAQQDPAHPWRVSARA